MGSRSCHQGQSVNRTLSETRAGRVEHRDSEWRTVTKNAVANVSNYGLGGSVWTTDSNPGRRPGAPGYLDSSKKF
jgi:hypothetical protein